MRSINDSPFVCNGEHSSISSVAPRGAPESKKKIPAYILKIANSLEIWKVPDDPLGYCDILF